jgi:hypothetical protein
MRGRVTRRALLVFFVLVLSLLCTATAWGDEPPGGVTGSLFERIHDGLTPLAPLANQVADAMQAVSDAMIQAIRNGESVSDDLEPLVEQASGAIASLQSQLMEVVEQLSPALAQLEGVAEKANTEFTNAAFQLDAALREREPALSSFYKSLGPALGPLCEARGQAPLLLSLIPYGFALQGVVEPLEPVCGGVSVPAPPTDALQPALTQYGDIVGGSAYALGPLAPPLAPAFQPLCSALGLVSFGSTLVSLPISPTPLVGPTTRAACALAPGPSLSGPAVIFLSIAAEPLASLATDEAVNSIQVLVPVTAPFRPLLIPMAAGACQALPLVPTGVAILPIPLPIETEPLVVVSTSMLCSALAESEPPGGGVTEAPSVDTQPPPTPVSFNPGPGAARFDAPPPASSAALPPIHAPAPAAAGAALLALLPQIVWALVPAGLLLLGVLSWIVWDPDPAGRPLWMRSRGFRPGILR